MKRAKRRAPARETVAALKKRLRSLEKRNDLVMDAINEGVYDWNVLDGSIVYSTGVQKAVGLPDKLRTLADWRDRIHPEDLPRYLQGFVEHFKGRTERYSCDYRYRAADGVAGDEGAFVACSFWMVQNLALVGEHAEAERLFRNLLRRANHLGLLAEEIDPATGEQLGNFPLGLSHAALINTATILERLRPAQEPSAVSARS